LAWFAPPLFDKSNPCRPGMFDALCRNYFMRRDGRLE
jgi:hypothetical protein